MRKEPATHCPKTILVVDDEEIVRLIVTRMLRHLGYAVLEAEHGKQGLHVAHKHDRPIDLIITDVVMPGMNGPHLVEQMKGGRPELKVLYMSSYPAHVIIDRGLLDPAMNFIDKSSIDVDLVKKVCHLLGDRPPT